MAVGKQNGGVFFIFHLFFQAVDINIIVAAALHFYKFHNTTSLCI